MFRHRHILRETAVELIPQRGVGVGADVRIARPARAAISAAMSRGNANPVAGFYRSYAGRRLLYYTGNFMTGNYRVAGAKIARFINAAVGPANRAGHHFYTDGAVRYCGLFHRLNPQITFAVNDGSFHCSHKYCPFLRRQIYFSFEANPFSAGKPDCRMFYNVKSMTTLQ